MSILDRYRWDHSRGEWVDNPLWRKPMPQPLTGMSATCQMAHFIFHQICGGSHEGKPAAQQTRALDYDQANAHLADAIRALGADPAEALKQEGPGRPAPEEPEDYDRE